MNEHLIVKSFGPVKDLDITFKKVTLFIGDQGTGKSCVAKRFFHVQMVGKGLGYEASHGLILSQIRHFQTVRIPRYRYIHS